MAVRRTQSSNLQHETSLQFATDEARFGREIGFSIVDKRDMMVVRSRGWEALSLLESEGNYEHIKRKLTRFLEVQYAAKLITSEAYGQALGQADATFN